MNLQFVISELRADGIAVTKASIKAKAVELRAGQALLNEALAEIEPVAPVQDATQHDAVETYLQNLKAGNAEQFDIERRLPFAEQVVKAGA